MACLSGRNLAPNKERGSAAMGPSAANPKILYRNSRLLRMVFLQLHRQQRADLFCDVVLQAEGEAVPAHCCILSACSPFFTERLEKEMPHKGRKVVLELRGLKIGTLRKLVDFLYTSEMEVSREEAQDVLAAARQLQVSELESLQLEGGKLVKKALGRRLNRNCLQLSSPVSIPETSLIQSPPNCSGNSPTSWLVTHKQKTSVKLPCTKAMGNSNNIDQKETKKQKPAAAPQNGNKQAAGSSTATLEPLRTKPKKCPAGTVRNIFGSDERGNQHAQKAKTEDKQATADSQETKKIKLSRPKLSSLPLHASCVTKDTSAVAPNKTSRSIKRLWRQKSPGKDEAKGAADGHVPGFWSPPHIPKTTKGRKRSSSESTPSSNPAQEAGQIGRVKLRKVINGSCWEVVQESPAAHPMKVGSTPNVCTLTEEGSLPQLRYLEQAIANPQQLASSARLLPVEPNTSPLSEKASVGHAGSKVALDEANSAIGDPYELDVFMLEQQAEGEQYDNLASAGELEHMLDLLLADDDVVGEPQSTTGPEGMSISCPAPGTAGSEEKECSAETLVCSQWIKAKNSPLPKEQEAADPKISKETPGTANGSPLLDPVCDYLPPVPSQPNRDCIDMCKPASPLQDGWTAQHQLPVLEKRTVRLADPLSVTLTDEDQGRVSYRVGTSGAETKASTQVLLRNPLQPNLDCKLLPLLANLEEEDIDVGGVEELFVSIECVRPDPSPVSESEVDVLN